MKDLEELLLENGHGLSSINSNYISRERELSPLYRILVDAPLENEKKIRRPKYRRNISCY